MQFIEQFVQMLTSILSHTDHVVFHKLRHLHNTQRAVNFYSSYLYLHPSFPASSLSTESIQEKLQGGK